MTSSSEWQIREDQLALADAVLAYVMLGECSLASISASLQRPSVQLEPILSALCAYDILTYQAKTQTWRMVCSPSVIDVCSLEKKLKIHLLHTHVIHSSNTWLMQCLANKCCANYAHKNAIFNGKSDHWSKDDAYAVVPEFQTQGRGRQNRVWLSGFAQGVLCSLAMYLPVKAHELSGLSLACGAQVALNLNERLASCNALSESLQLKWPNDLVRQGETGQAEHYEKLGGVLVEVAQSDDQGCWVVVGVGINVGSAPAGVNGNNVPGAMTGLSRQAVVESVLSALVYVMRRFPKQGFAHWQKSWQELHAFAKKNVLIQRPCGTVAGVCQGVDAHGALQLLHNGQTESFWVGDVSLRPDIT